MAEGLCGDVEYDIDANVDRTCVLRIGHDTDFHTDGILTWPTREG